MRLHVNLLKLSPSVRKVLRKFPLLSLSCLAARMILQFRASTNFEMKPPTLHDTYYYCILRT